MAILIRTRDLPAEQRHEAWRRIVCDTLGPLDLRIDPDTPLRGEIGAGLLGPVSVGRVKTSTPHSVHRTPGLIRRESPEVYRAAMAMSGSVLLQQDGRVAQLRQGEFTIYDFTRPYELTYDAAVQLAVFSFPRDMLALPLDLVAGLTCVPVSATGGAGALNEIEDLAALIEAAGGPAMVFGGSSGAALALRAAAQIPAISRLALWEPPYHVGPGAPALPLDFATQLGNLVTAGRRAEAAGLFLVQAAEVPEETVAAMRAEPSWPGVEAIAHTLSYEAAVMGPGNELPARLLASVTQPTLVLTGGNSPGWMTAAGRAVAGTVPAASHRVLAGQTHNVTPQAIVPELLKFFTAA